MTGDHAAQALEGVIVGFANLAMGSAMVWLDPERLPPPYRKVLTWHTTTERGRKRLGWFLMILGVLVVAADLAELAI